MKTLIRVILISIVLIVMSALMSGCRAGKDYASRNVRDSLVYIEKFVTVPAPEDSASIRALMECDENGKVVLRWLDQESSKNSMLSFKLDSLGNLLAMFRNKPDSIQVKEVYVYRDREVEVEKIVEVEKKLSKWQNLKIETGGMSLGILFVALVYFIIKLFKSVKSVSWSGVWSFIFKK